MIERRELPGPLRPLYELAFDLRWTWSHECDALWQRIDAEAWDRTQNPWEILADVPAERLRALAADAAFVEEIERLAAARRNYLAATGWFASAHGAGALGGVAYFSMEFGLGEALPLYAGGLGVLAGDYLKTASDLGLPVVGVGLLYQQGYFRQVIDAQGWQREAFPYNDPDTMPLRPVLDAGGAWRHVELALPGRSLLVRLWQAMIGRVPLYLLDSNDPRNRPVDRAITARLYDSGSETRLLQEMLLGVAGWRAIEAAAPGVEICHLNEGHAAFVIVERARAAMRRLGLGFAEALWATRAGNVFTTHTPVAAGFDVFGEPLIEKYAHYLEPLLAEAGIDLADLLALGRIRPGDNAEPFGMACLAMRGSLATFGVSRLHGRVSRRIFAPLFPRWPEAEVPVGHVTNGVHVPGWDSSAADALWTAACGKERWRAAPEDLGERICAMSDKAVWEMRGEARAALVQQVRLRLAGQLAERGLPSDGVALAATVLDPNALTLGFARRFTAYKRPNLLLHDKGRLTRLLTDPARPVQLVLAGKAHPADDEGKAMIRDWILLAQRPELRRRVVFLEDYDLALAEALVQGVDVWINTPRRRYEACGTSGMKVLVNGGINLSVRDGWWAEAYRPDLGWAIEDGNEAAPDDEDALTLYRLIEEEVVPEFYTRDAAGLPRRWLERVRNSLALTSSYGAGRMAREYAERYYLPGAAEWRRRLAGGAAPARAMAAWESRLRRRWPDLHIGAPTVSGSAAGWRFAVPVYLGEIAAADVAVQLYADAAGAGEPPLVLDLARVAAIAGATGGYLYEGLVPAARPASDYTARIVPRRDGVRIPAELPLIRWQR